MDITKILEGLLDQSNEVKREQKKLCVPIIVLGIWGCLSMAGLIYCMAMCK